MIDRGMHIFLILYMSDQIFETEVKIWIVIKIV